MIEVERPILPPERYEQDCVARRVDPSVEAELRRLSGLVTCERANNAGQRAWRRSVTPE